MKKKTKKGLTLVLLAVFLVSTILLIGKWFDKQSGSDAYADALAIASGNSDAPPVQKDVSAEAILSGANWIPAPIAEEDPQIAELSKIDLDALREVNPHVIGWIRIPDTKIDYPLLQGEDNDYYLNHTWKGKKNSVGSIYLEHQNKADLTDYNTIIYGHNMADGSMFAALRDYSVKTFWKDHPHVYILTDAGVYRYDIFAAYKADIESNTYGMNFQQDRTKANLLNMALEKTKFDAGVIPATTDRILTLSTCYGSSNQLRWVVQARLQMVEVQ